MRPKIRENLRTANFNQNLLVIKKRLIEMQICADS